MEDEQVLDNLILELRRGVIVLAVLSQLQVEQYGYSVMRLLSEKGLGVDQGTLYPLLRRMETQGLLQSSWRVEADRPRRYYVISPQGKAILPKVKDEWHKIAGTLEGILGSERKSK